MTIATLEKPTIVQVQHSFQCMGKLFSSRRGQGGGLDIKEMPHGEWHNVKSSKAFAHQKMRLSIIGAACALKVRID